MYNKFAKFITDQNISLVFNLIGMYDKARKWNRRNIDNCIEIYTKSDIKHLIENKKRIYNTNKNIVGVDIKPELLKNPNIIIKNDISKNISQIANELILKIKKLK